MTEQARFVDNGNGTITDHKLQLMWKKTDSFQDTKKWQNWFRGHEYMQIVNLENFGGFDDWRFPYEDEAFSLLELNKTNKDKYGDDIYLDSVFEPGSAGVTWTEDVKESAALVVQYEDGVKVWPSQYANLNMAVRLCRNLT
ncbi:Lcl domain-containing protein [Nitrospina sp. 32_T5]|uniref:Lcl domain-containing protein n=1 Tax=unclassified Nitrospina TaxID=2638683 RepID=UPI003F9774D7